MTNTAENLILDRFSNEELEKADLGRLRMLAKELREQRDVNDRARAAAAEPSPITSAIRTSLPRP